MGYYFVRFVPKDGILSPFGKPARLGILSAESEKDGLRKLGFDKIIKDKRSGVLGGEHEKGTIYLEEVGLISSPEELAQRMG